MKIPKIIHFIWAGGTRLLPQQNIDVIKKWADANPSFEIYIWIDKNNYIKETALSFGISTSKPETKEKLLQELMDYYQNKFKLFKNKVVFKDVVEEKVTPAAARYEMDRLDPNYGASSDIIRAHVLAKVGGFYFDSDVHPNPQKNLESLDCLDQEIQSIIGLEHNSQNRKKIGNDAFMCTPEHPFMLAFAKISHDNYYIQSIEKSSVYQTWLEEKFPKKDQFIGEAFDAFDRGVSYRKDFTVETTGPELVRKLLLVVNTHEKNFLMIDIQSYISHHNINDINWIRAPIKKIQNPEDALTILFDTILFEIEAMQIFRAEFHIRVLAKALNIDEEKASKIFIDFLEQKEKETKKFFSLLKNIYCEFNYTHPLLIDFYNEAKVPLENFGLVPGKILAHFEVKVFFQKIFHCPYFKEKKELEQYDPSDPCVKILLASLPNEKTCVDSAFKIIILLSNLLKEIKFINFEYALQYVTGLNDAMIDFTAIAQTTDYGAEAIEKNQKILLEFNEFLINKEEEIHQKIQEQNVPKPS